MAVARPGLHPESQGQCQAGAASWSSGMSPDPGSPAGDGSALLRSCHEHKMVWLLEHLGPWLHPAVLGKVTLLQSPGATVTKNQSLRACNTGQIILLQFWSQRSEIKV
jgi:hypothetical protein